MKKSVFISAITFLLFSLFFATTVFAADLMISGDLSTDILTDEAYALIIKLQNVGDNEITNVYVYIDNEDDLEVCYLEGEQPTSKIKAGDTQDTILNVRAESAGTYSVGVRAEYIINGSKEESYATVNIRAKTNSNTSPTPTPAPDGSPDVRLTGPSSVVTMTQGESKEVTLQFKNISKDMAYRLLVLTSPSEYFRLEFVDGADSVKTLSHAASANTASIKIRVSTNEKLKPGTYPVDLDWTYYNSKDKGFSGNGKFYITVLEKDEGEDDTGKSSVTVSDFLVSGNFNAGETFKVTATVKNNGEKTAENVQLVVSNVDTKALSVFNGSSTSYINTLEPGKSQNVTFEFISHKDMKSGSYPIKYTLSYIDKITDKTADAPAEQTADYTYYVNIVETPDEEDDERALLEIVSVTPPSGIFDVGQQAHVKMTIKNTGVKTAKNIKIAADSGTAVVPMSSSTVVVNELAPGAERTLSFSFSANDTSETRNYSIGFTVTYETGVVDSDGVKDTDTFSQYVGMNVNNPEDEEDEDEDESKKSVPKIIVSKYAVNPVIVQAGQEFDLEISFMNTHKLKAITNIKVYFSVPGTETEKGNVFTPVDASNTFYIDEMGPKTESHHILRLYTVPDAKAKNYVMVIKFEYEDADGNAFESTEEVGINVKQVSKLDIGEIVVPPSVMPGEDVYVSFNVHNTGKVTLYNLKMKFEGEGVEGAQSEMIFGNFASGVSDYYDGSFRFMEPGPKKVSLVISYDTDSGEPVKDVREFDVEVMDMGGGMGGGFEGGGMQQDGYYDEKGNFISFDDGMNGGMGEESGILSTIMGFFNLPWVWGVLGVVATGGGFAIVLTVLYVRKKRGLN